MLSYNYTCLDEDVDSNSELTDASTRTIQDESYNTFEDNGKWRTHVHTYRHVHMYEGVHVNVYMHVRMYECTHVLQDYATCSWLRGLPL